LKKIIIYVDLKGNSFTARYDLRKYDNYIILEGIQKPEYRI